MRARAFAVVLGVLACDAPAAKAEQPIPGPGSAPVEEVEVGADREEAAVSHTPMKARALERFRFGAEDPLTDERKTHYVKSNEIRHDLFFPYIQDKGGAYVGVGSDPNYTLIGVARPQYAFLLDIDRMVVDLHFVYEILIEASPDPAALHDRFLAKNRNDSVALLENALAGRAEDDRRRIVLAYKAARETVYRHLRHVIGRTRGGVPTSWLSNPEFYATVRSLYQDDRIRIMTGDLRGTESMASIANAAKELGVPIRVFYPSNAEEYFPLGPRYVANVLALPVDDQSVVCRTVYTKPKNSTYGHSFDRADMLWNYQVHSFLDYRRRLGAKHLTRDRMLQLAEHDGGLVRDTGVKGFSVVAVEPSRG